MDMKNKNNIRHQRFTVWFIISAVIVLAIVAVIARGLWFKSGNVEAPSSRVTGSEIALAIQPKADFQTLLGKWQRPDGGYIIEVRKVESDGKMDASYFNPSPINVSKAEASQDGGTIRVFIELRDVNYPGSTYHLTYDPGNDCLKGNYFQAALKENFDVYFVRLKP
jgi:hypothetical protein